MTKLWNGLPIQFQGALIIGAGGTLATALTLGLASQIGPLPTVALFGAGFAIFGAWLAKEMDD